LIYRQLNLHPAKSQPHTTTTLSATSCTLLLHFNPNSKESSKEKIMRLIKNAIQMGCLT